MVGVTRAVVHPLPAPDDPMRRGRAPRHIKITTSAPRTIGDGPYRSSPEKPSVRVTWRPSPWVVGGVGAFGGLMAMPALGWIGAAVVTIAAAALLVLAFGRRRIIVENGTLAVRGTPGSPVDLRLDTITSIETCEHQSRVGVELAGVTVDHRETSTYELRARLRDGTTVRLLLLPSLDDCWHVQEALARAL